MEDLVATRQERRVVEIISKGRVVDVTETELTELRARCGAVGWYRYCQLRLTMGHAEAIAAIR